MSTPAPAALGRLQNKSYLSILVTGRRSGHAGASRSKTPGPQAASPAPAVHGCSSGVEEPALSVETVAVAFLEMSSENDGVQWSDVEQANNELGTIRSTEMASLRQDDADWEDSLTNEGSAQLLTDVAGVKQSLTLSSTPPPPPPPKGARPPPPPGPPPALAGRQKTAGGLFL